MINLNDYELVASNTETYQEYLKLNNMNSIKYTKNFYQRLTDDQKNILDGIKYTGDYKSMSICFDLDHDYIDISLDNFFTEGIRDCDYTFNVIAHSVWKKRKRIKAKNYTGQGKGSTL